MTNIQFGQWKKAIYPGAAGGLLAISYLSEGRPLFVRSLYSTFTLGNLPPDYPLFHRTRVAVFSPPSPFDSITYSPKLAGITAA
jgi:hypothetical protein